MMMSFGRPFTNFPPSSMSMMMPDMDWIAIPRSVRPPSAFDDFFNMDREIENFWRTVNHHHQPAAGHSSSSSTKKVTQPNTNTEQQQQQQQQQADSSEKPKNSWVKISSTFNTAQDGPHSVSRRTVRVRDETGRDELVEERSLDGRVSKRKSDLRSASTTKQQLGSGGVEQEQQEQDQQENTAIENTQAAMEVVDEEFDRLWAQDELVKQMMGHSHHGARRSHKKSKVIQIGGQEDDNKPREQQAAPPAPPQEPGQEQGQQGQQGAEEVTETQQPFPVADDSSSNSNEFHTQLRQIAQLGLPCDSTTFRLLQHTQGNVERTVMGLLSLQRMKSMGLDDEAACVAALCSANFDLDKACALVKSM